MFPTKKTKERGGVREGILHSSGDIIAFIDADLACDLSAISQTLYEFQADESIDVIISNRRMDGSSEYSPLLRKIVSFFCRVIVLVILGLHYTDTQSGYKAFKRDIAFKLAEKQRINGFSFDVEYLYIAKLHKLKVKQIPVTYNNDRKNSTVRILRDSIRFFTDIIGIRVHTGTYK